MSYPELKLISFTLCPYVQRARIILLEKQLKHDVEYIDLDMPPDWFFDISPLEKVPVLLVDGEAIFESMVICDFIDEIFPTSLYPAEPVLKAQHRGWIALGDSVLSMVYDLMFASEERRFKQAKGSIIDRLDVLEDGLDASPFYSGQQFGMVDVAYAPLFRYLLGLSSIFDVDFFVDTPNVLAWARACLDYPAVKDSVIDNYQAEFIAYLDRPDTILASLTK